MGIVKSVPKNIQLSKDLSHRIPWSTECLTPPRTPSGEQLQHKVQSPLRQVANALVVQSLAMLLASGHLWLTIHTFLHASKVMLKILQARFQQ